MWNYLHLRYGRIKCVTMTQPPLPAPDDATRCQLSPDHDRQGAGPATGRRGPFNAQDSEQIFSVLATRRCYAVQINYTPGTKAVKWQLNTHTHRHTHTNTHVAVAVNIFDTLTKASETQENIKSSECRKHLGHTYKYLYIYVYIAIYIFARLWRN